STLFPYTTLFRSIRLLRGSDGTGDIGRAGTPGKSRPGRTKAAAPAAAASRRRRRGCCVEELHLESVVLAFIELQFRRPGGGGGRVSRKAKPAARWSALGSIVNYEFSVEPYANSAGSVDGKRIRAGFFGLQVSGVPRGEIALSDAFRQTAAAESAESAAAAELRLGASRCRRAGEVLVIEVDGCQSGLSIRGVVYRGRYGDRGT